MRVETPRMQIENIALHARRPMLRRPATVAQGETEEAHASVELRLMRAPERENVAHSSPKLD
jgi:hypothetical protein